MSINKPDLERIIENINRIKPFSGVVLVQQNDKVIFQKAYGYANRSDEAANTVATRFGLLGRYKK